MSQCMDDINPTGSDPNEDHWDVVADVIKALGHIAFIDMAYQGLGDGLAKRGPRKPQGGADIPCFSCVTSPGCLAFSWVSV